MMKTVASARGHAWKAGGVLLAALAGAAVMSESCGAQAAAAPEAVARASWRAAISRTPTERPGCFEASYPSLAWSRATCVSAPQVPYAPRSGAGGPRTVGDGDDYAIRVKGLISSAVGSFPVVTGVKTETQYGQPNTYSLQLNSQYYHGGAACDGAKTPAKCLSWLQYVYSSAEKSVFMEYFVFHYDAMCPPGWHALGHDCFMSSAAVRAPQEPITDLAGMSLSGSALNGGLDTAVFMDGSKAYAVAGSDSVVGLAAAWTGAEFNVIGESGGAQAVFNAGSSITVNLAVADGGTATPTCKPGGGTTGETNNLNLGACTSAGGARPSITFVETN